MSDHNDPLTNATLYYYSENSPVEEGNFWYLVDGEVAVWEIEIPDFPVEVPNEYFIFTLLDDGTYSITAKDVNYMPSEVVIPSTYNGKAVTSIGYSAFRNCNSLTSVVIPNSVTSIDSAAFYDCHSLVNVAIPNSVTYIGDYAFMECTSLTSVAIPSSVMKIGYMAFTYCSNLTIIVIPNSITTIGNFEFYGCSSLKDVYYTGSKEEWAKISIGSNNSDLTGATIHYNYVPEE